MTLSMIMITRRAITIYLPLKLTILISQPKFQLQNEPLYDYDKELKKIVSNLATALSEKLKITLKNEALYNYDIEKIYL